MGFEWDAEKEAMNLAKHGIGFVEASQIFSKPILERIDNRRDYGETRLIALGEYDGIVLCVIYTKRQKNHRIISAWRASKNDRQTYEKACQL